MSARRERPQGSATPNPEMNGMNLSELKERSISELNQIAGDLIQLGDASLLQLRQVHAVHLRVRRRASLGSLSAGAHLRAPGAASNRRMPVNWLSTKCRFPAGLER